MNKKFVWIVISVLVWFLVIGGFAFYYIFNNVSSVEQNESIVIKETAEVNSNQPNVIATPQEKSPSVADNKEIVEPIQKIDLKPNEHSLAKKEGVSIKIDKKENPEIDKTDIKQNIKIKKENESEDSKEEVGGITIYGNVIDLKTNKSIEGVNISFFTNEGQFLKRANTDKDGRFEVNHVNAKQIHIRLQKEHYINEVYKNFSLDELSQHLLLKMDPGFIIKGVVKEKTTNLPLTGVTVEMYRGNTIVKKGESSDLNGNFKIDAVPLGSIELVFSKIGFSQISQPLNIEKSETPNLEILLEKSSSLAIEVITLDGFVVVPKVSVYFDGGQTAKIYERSILTQDQSKNIFRIPGIERQYSKLRINAEGFTFPAEKPLTIVPGQETNIVFEVSRGITVVGSIRGASGNFLPDVTIKLYEVFGGGRAASDDVLKGTVISDKNGKFSFSGITPGNIEVVTSSTVYKRVQKKFLIEEKNNPEIEITVDAESFFKGKVSDAEGQAINTTEVRFVPINSDGKFDPKRDRPVFEGSPAAGEFRMSGVSAGLYRVSITASGFIAYIEERYEVKNEQTSGEFKLIKGLSLTGIVKNEEGASIIEAEVKLLVSKKESEVKYNSMTDYNGFFAISGLEENVTYKLQIQGKGYKIYEKEVLVQSGTNHFQIVLQKKLSFSGIVIDTNTNLPIQNFQIKIFAKFTQGLIDDSSETFNVPNGQFSIPVNAEVFNMELKSPDYAIYQLKNIKISDPIQNHYLVKAGSVNVKLMLGKLPGSMKLIQLSKTKDIETDEEKRNVRTDSNGNALIQNLMPGEYFVRVAGIKGFANYDDVLTVHMEVETKKEIVLIPGLTVKGRLLNVTTNIPIVSAEVYLDLTQYVKYPVKDYIDNDGFFNFKNVGVGKHTITVNYGPMVNGRFSQSSSIEIDVPELVRNTNGIYQIEDILLK